MPFTGSDDRTAQRDLMARKRASDRDIKTRPVADPARRESCRNDDSRFLRTYLSGVFYHPFNSAQEDLIADCGRALRYGTTKAKAAPRGDGKSSIVKYLQLKYGLYRQLRFPLTIAATATKAVAMLRDIKAKLRSPVNKELHEDFPFECDLARYVSPAPSRANNATWGGLPVHIVWSPDQIVLPSLPDGAGGYDQAMYGLPEDPAQLGTILMCLGFTSDSLQGCNVYDIRPDFVMLDDLDSRDSLSAEHGAIAEKIEECIDKTVAGLGGPGRQLGQVYTCTITSRRSAAFRYTDREQKPAWDGERCPRVIEWPARKDLWEEYIRLRNKSVKDDKFSTDARRFVADNFNAMHEGAVLSNEHDYEAEQLPDRMPKQMSALQKCYDYIALHGMESFETEHQNSPPEDGQQLETQVTASRMLECVGPFHRLHVDSTTTMITRGIDIRKTEVHWTAMAGDDQRTHQVIDYDVRSHGTSETTVQQAEALILANLHSIADEWDREQFIDENGMRHTADLTLVDKGWVGSWTEDGEVKTWVTQPVETFCMERPGRLRRWMPAKGAPRYASPAPGQDVIVGDHWHMNRGEGKQRRCTEVIWDADHWHLLVEELFMLPAKDSDRFELFVPSDGIWTNHKAFGEHITVGAEQLKAQMSRGTRTRKPRFVRDHWWDSCAMMLVAQSVERWFRENVRTQTPQRPPQRICHTSGQEIGAR